MKLRCKQDASALHASQTLLTGFEKEWYGANQGGIGVRGVTGKSSHPCRRAEN